jgi:hypothetical protein
LLPKQLSCAEADTYTLGTSTAAKRTRQDRDRTQSTLGNAIAGPSKKLCAWTVGLSVDPFPLVVPQLPPLDGLLHAEKLARLLDYPPIAKGLDDMIVDLESSWNLSVWMASDNGLLMFSQQLKDIWFPDTGGLSRAILTRHVVLGAVHLADKARDQAADRVGRTDINGRGHFAIF